MEQASINEIYLRSAILEMERYKALGDKTMAQLNDEQLHYQYNETSNSIATIVRHLHGNMLSRWTNFLTEDGEKPWRKRDEEFGDARESREQLLQLWEAGWAAVLGTLRSLSEADLTHTVTIRHQPHNVIDAINRQLAHYPYHVGQIVFIGKMLQDKNWQQLSIAKNASQQFNEQMKEKWDGEGRKAER